mgnify:FL=1
MKPTLLDGSFTTKLRTDIGNFGTIKRAMKLEMRLTSAKISAKC